jgi:hypothetical protein
VQKAIKVDSNHVLVVYHQLADNSVQRRIIQGPTLFVPEAGERYVDTYSNTSKCEIFVSKLQMKQYVSRLHDFEWHGQDPNSEGRMIPGLKKFTHVEIIPNQFYYNVSMQV